MKCPAGETDGVDLGMGGRVGVPGDAVGSGRYDAAVPDDDGAERAASAGRTGR